MPDAIIQVENIFKEYRIGSRRERYQTLREHLTESARNSIRAFRPGKAKQSDKQCFRALDGVSFEVQSGEIFGLIGANGAGKTTLLKILSRITEPTSGRAKISGRVASLLEVGTGFHSELTGRENVYLNGAILGMKNAEIKRKFDEIVSFAEVETFIDTPVKHFSSGMYLRLAFAVAAHLEPEILFVDEVLAVGDASFQNKCLGKMGDIAGEGRTVIFVSHNMPAVKNLCGRVLLLERGRVKREGDAASVVKYYLQGHEQSCTRTWPITERPGNGGVRLNSMKILDMKGEVVSQVNISDPLVVELEYEILKAGSSVAFSLTMFDADGYGLFAALNNTEQKYYGRPLNTGIYRSRCKIDGDLLNAGYYNFSIAGFGANWTDPFRVDHVVAFEAVDDGLLRGDYYGPYGGPLRPRLEWETTVVDQ